MKLAMLVAVLFLASAGVATAGDDNGPGHNTVTNTSSSTSGASNANANTYEDANNPASSAANLYLATCTSGASAQVFGGGGSLGGPDVVCSLLNVAQVSFLVGDEVGGLQALQRAQEIMVIRTNPVLRYLQGIPILRHLF